MSSSEQIQFQLDTEPTSCMPTFTVNMQVPSTKPDSCMPVPSADKAELYRILNAFQNSHDYGVYICQKFRDQRKHYIDSYYDEVADEAFGVIELAGLVGKQGEPLSEQARREFSRFAATLRELASRIERVVC